MLVSLASMPNNTSWSFGVSALMKLDRSMIVLLRISSCSWLRSSSIWHCYFALVICPAFWIWISHTRYLEMIVMIDCSRPAIVIKDQRPKLCGSCPELVMPLQSGCWVMIVVPPGLYNAFQCKSLSEVMKWESFQYRFHVCLRVDTPRGCFQWVFVSARQDMSIS